MMYNIYVMAVIYYALYDNSGLSVAQANTLEHQLGRKLLAFGLAKLFNINTSFKELKPISVFLKSENPF